ncbi:MAG: RagB/SusD family nutrient uptake outer membrane protein [Saprospiraceae bacterium]|nr:RagB/SusD family nutrient uptake outer membrane protein [Lewinellaceae bacterium]
MKFKTYKIGALLFLGVALFAVSCFKDLDTIPLNENEVTSATVYEDPAAYRQVLAKLYAGLAVSGQQGPDGQPDISGIDEGFSTYIRQYWKAQELSTDEAVIAWNDGNIHDYEQQDWDANNEFIRAMYNRIFYQISLCNEFIRETTDAKLDSRGVDAALRADIVKFRAEARFLRALSYWHALDMFRQVPFVTEADAVGSFLPRQASAEELFNYVESELKAIEPELVAPRQNEYGRADQAAAWMVLAKLYLNAETYVNRNHYTDCITYTKKVIDAGYTLDPNYARMFMADNDNADGIIFAVRFDGTRTRTWGGMTFVCHAAVGGSMSAAAFGLDGGWGGTRVTKALVEKFPATGGSVLVSPNDGGTYPVIYAPGSYQGWDPATANQLASKNNDNTYEGYINFPTDGEKFKFTVGPSWPSGDFGDNGGDGTLEAGGADIVVAEAGFYKINVDLNANTYTMTKTAWGLIGDATPGGWGSDQDMTYDPAEGAWVIQLDLVAGKIKFRANDDWPLNYGDPNGDALLTEGGADIDIPSPSTYLIKLYLDKPDYTYSIERPVFDRRAMFHTDGQSLEISDISQFTEGYAVTKFSNLRSDGTPGSNLTWVDTDFPMFRIEDAYLMYAEAVRRGGVGGDINLALELVNRIRQRAYAGSAGDITVNDMTLDFILDERARELYWECHRRTDLIRFGRFSETDYLWPFKGNSPTGESRPSFYDVFPIPSSDIGANPNLVQNPGY